MLRFQTDYNAAIINTVEALLHKPDFEWKIFSDYASVQQRAGLESADGGIQYRVEKNLHLSGAVMAGNEEAVKHDRIQIVAGLGFWFVVDYGFLDGKLAAGDDGPFQVGIAFHR
ncbi:MAG: hypothetical protein AB2990_01940 [Candidatus Symbiodolus clandestinus]